MESKTNFLVKTQQTTDDPQGTEYTLAIVSDAEKAIVIKLLNYGATIISIATPNREKNVEEITVCYPTITKLKTKLGPYFGCIAGRVANRVSDIFFERRFYS